MKKLFPLFFLLTFFIMASGYDISWREVKAFEDKNLPKSALTKVEAIYAQAKQDKNENELIKALLYKEKYHSVLEEDGYVKAIGNIEKEMNSTTIITTKLILKSLLAQMVSNYLNANRHKIQQRSSVENNSSDMLTWSVDRLVERSSQLYLESLGDEAKEVNIKEYKTIMYGGLDSLELRPTLYDFLAFRALSHFNNERNYLTQPIYAFYIEEKEAFSSFNTFISHEFKSKDKSSFKYQALLIYQKLLKFHKKQNNEKALEYINFERLQFVYRNFTAPNRDKYYLHALNSLQSKFSKSDALYYLADYYLKKEDYTKALNYANRGIKSQKRYLSNRCQIVKNSIKRQTLNFEMEQVNLPNENLLSKITYRNLKSLYIKVIKINPNHKKRVGSYYWNEINEYINGFKTLNEFNITLPSSSDYKEHSTEISLGKYPYGEYIFVVSKDKEFKDKFAYNYTTISKIAYLYKRKNSTILVVDRESGEPLEGVKAHLYTEEYNKQKGTYEKKLMVTKVSNEKGLILAPKKDITHLSFEYKGDRLNVENGIYYHKNDEEREQTDKRVYFFTDRAIYRPNQTIYFKGLAVQSYGNKRPNILTKKKITVRFYNTNHQTIATKIVTTDAFGTFNGSFTAPKNGLLGAMRLSADIGGSQSIRVEEYKRPKFEVTFNKLDKSYRLGSSVTVKGQAKGYAGNGIDGATVKYSVRRVADFPWLGWWQPLPQSATMQIAYGEVQTNQKGEFQILFKALPDKSILAEDKPNFTYEVSVDVTDSTGETQSNYKSVNLGYVAIKASMNIADELDANATNFLTLATTNLDGEFKALKGKILIEKFKDKTMVYRKRYWSEPDQPLYKQKKFEKLFKSYEYPQKSIEKIEVQTLKFDTKVSKKVTLPTLEQGEYLLTLKTSDKDGTSVQKSQKITIYDMNSTKPPYQSYLWKKLDKEVYGVEENATIILKTSSSNTAVLLGIQRQNRGFKEKWITLKALTTEQIVVKKGDRGNILYTVDFIKDNREYHETGVIKVPWDTSLNVEYLTFRDKLQPNSKEQWSLKISGKNKEKVMAQMVATLYDASLDTFTPHQFGLPNLYPQNYENYENRWSGNKFNSVANGTEWMINLSLMQRNFYRFNWFGLRLLDIRDLIVHKKYRGVKASEIAPTMSDSFVEEEVMMIKNLSGQDISDIKSEKKSKPIKIRTNLQETVFFKPNLQTDKEGNIIINFTTNDALTRWKFLAFAHTKDLRTLVTQKEIVTQKELMVVTNLPRFFREKDTIILSAKVVNMSDKDLKGHCELELINPLNEEILYGERNLTKPFFVEKGASIVVSFQIKIPDVDKVSAIKHTIIAKTATHSDGEQVIKPILSNRMFITESKALYLKGKESRSFTLKSLAENNSTTLKHHKLTLDFTSNPLWYAVKSLPYLMEYPHECNEQLFNRYFANAVASKIANSTPKIKKIFESWKSKDELKSNLSTNQELKSVLLEETPWVLDAQSEEVEQKNIGLLFDVVKLAKEQKSTLAKLLKRQSAQSDGGWSWFQGGRSNLYITQYIVEGFGKLKALGIKQDDTKMLKDSVTFMDNEMLNRYQELLKAVKLGHIKLEKDHLESIIIHYLYARSFYNFSMTKKMKIAYDYYMKQAKEYWGNKGLYEQAMIALTLHQKNQRTDAKAIVKSLKEHALSDDELGMYFKYNQGFRWNELPIETHALMIEVFDTITHDKASVEQLKIWLLKQKQTTHWKTTKATASAIYALLLNNSQLLNNKQVKVDFNTTIDYQTKLKSAKAKAQKGTGYFKVSYNDFNKSMATVNLVNPNSNIAWGGLYWQYFEEMDKIKSFKETPLTINKELFVVKEGDRGERLIPLKKIKLKVGDRVKVRIEIRVDRDMEYIMLKDSRASTFEPTTVLSQYRYQDGLGYYQSTKDNATYFFMDYLKKGTYVFEYALFVTHKGRFSNGLTTIESMYAPEFRSHSKGVRIWVK